MSEEKKREPKVIHVDKLIIKANEVVLNPDHDHRPPFQRPDFHGPDDRKPPARDFWGFPLPRPIERPEEDQKKDEEDEKKD